MPTSLESALQVLFKYRPAVFALSVRAIVNGVVRYQENTL